MKTPWFAVALAAVLAVGMSPDFSEAKRLGSGKSTGMQKQAPAQASPQTPPSQAPAAPTAAATAGKPAVPAAAAAPAKRSWMGPLAGLAAGLGLAALFSSMGMGGELASFMMMALLAVAAFFVIRLVMARMRGGSGAQPALAGAGAGAAAGAGAGFGGTAAANQPLSEPAMARQGLDAAPSAPTSASAGSGEVSAMGTPLRPIQIGEALAPASNTPSAGMQLPEGFDLPAFERVAKMIFIRLQAANDKGDLDDLREFTTPQAW